MVEVEAWNLASSPDMKLVGMYNIKTEMWPPRTCLFGPAGIAVQGFRCRSAVKHAQGTSEAAGDS